MFGDSKIALNNKKQNKYVQYLFIEMIITLKIKFDTQDKSVLFSQLKTIKIILVFFFCDVLVK